MEMHQIRYFLALCEEFNFTRAAKRCGVAQPSLTRAIKQLEAELGGPLFVRNGRTSRLSNLGGIVRPYLAEIDRSAANAKRAAARISGSPFGLNPKAKEKSMRKVVYGAAIATVVLLLVVVVNVRPQLPATASSPTQASEIVDVRALMSTIDVKALPRQEIPSEVYE